MDTDQETARAGNPELPLRLPVVALVGRPNSGKSTLFNRLVHAQRAIVNDQPGVTRDRNVARATWDERAFLLIDTGGFEEGSDSRLNDSVRAQADLAAAEADAVIVVLDGKEGLNPLDRDFVSRLRRLTKPVLFAVNKLDSPLRDDDASDFFALGLNEVFPISSAHGRGIGDLMERLFVLLPQEAPVSEPAPSGEITLAIVGRPNAGKSSLLNRIVGYERAIVDSTPGTTRDPLDTRFHHGGQDYVLVDTAGIRRRPQVQEQLERSSVVRALRAIERAEVALLVLDATQEMSDQDARIAGYAWERGRALLIVVNKWDAVDSERRDRKKFALAIAEHYPTLAQVPIAFVSALTGRFVEKLFPAIEAIVATHRKELRTTDLNRVLESVTRRQAPPSVRGRRPRFLYVAQSGRAPVFLTIFCNRPDLIQPVYERYLTNCFRDAFELNGTPLRLKFKKKAGRDDSTAAGRTVGVTEPDAGRGEKVRVKKGEAGKRRSKPGTRRDPKLARAAKKTKNTKNTRRGQRRES